MTVGELLFLYEEAKKKNPHLSDGDCLLLLGKTPAYREAINLFLGLTGVAPENNCYGHPKCPFRGFREAARRGKGAV